MPNRIRETDPRRRTRDTIARLILELGFIVHVCTLAACADPDRTTGLTREDTELVGLWQGPMAGRWGKSVLTLRLYADSTMTADNDNRSYRHLDGAWTVSANRFVATATPGDGVVVTLVATAPFVHLQGTWSSNSATGSFDLAKR